MLKRYFYFFSDIRLPGAILENVVVFFSPRLGSWHEPWRRKWKNSFPHIKKATNIQFIAFFYDFDAFLAEREGFEPPDL
jgi:hypothetical protein